MAKWSDLPADLLNTINGHLELLPDKIRFRCVCTYWRSISLESPHLREPQPPWLLLPYTIESRCGLYNALEDRVCEIDLPEAGEKVFKGSGHGWVVTQQLNGSIHDVNPLTRVRLPLPPRYKFPDVFSHDPKNIGHEYVVENECYGRVGSERTSYTIGATNMRNYSLAKVALSCSPTNSNGFRAVAQFRSIRLAYCALGDEKWHDVIEEYGTRQGYEDVTFCGGKLYVMTVKGELMVCDDIVSCPKLRKCAPVYKDFGIITHLRLVASSNGIMAVMRNEDGREVQENKFIFTTRTDFVIFKLDDDQRWTRVKCLGSDEILFMGMGAQFDFSSKGSYGNQIYFSSDHLNFNCQDIENCFDNGIFNVKDKKIRPLRYEFNPKKIWPSPIWVIPNPY